MLDHYTIISGLALIFTQTSCYSACIHIEMSAMIMMRLAWVGVQNSTAWTKTYAYTKTLFTNFRFPRSNMCDFKIRIPGNVQRYSVQCALPINLYNEMIFTILWFWFVIISNYWTLSSSGIKWGWGNSRKVHFPHYLYLVAIIPYILTHLLFIPCIVTHLCHIFWPYYSLFPNPSCCLRLTPHQ